MEQLHALFKSVKSKSYLLDHYDHIIKEQLFNNFTEEVAPNTQVTESSHYIHHHTVVKNSDTTHIRIVYKCSSKSSKNTISK